MGVGAKSAPSPGGSGSPRRLLSAEESPDSQAAQGERRHLSVLFCDLVDSTEIAASLDPEDWRDLVAAYHTAATAAVERLGGYVAQYLGDGLLVYFGFPQAHEDDPRRAVLAGLAILDAIAALNRRSTSKRLPQLKARIGIHSGSAVVGESGGRNANIFGDVPNVASRVQTAAVPDTVLITGSVHHLVSGLFVVEDRGEQRLKGIERPARLYRVVQPSGARGRLEAARLRGLTPFVKREDELRLLMNRWARAIEGEGQVTLVIGEPGIGKSRLVQRFHEQIADTRHSWLDCATASLQQNTPFYAVEDLLHQSFRWRREQSDDERLAALEASLAMAGLKLSEAVPLIAPLMNFPAPTRYPPLRMPVDQQRKRLLATITAWALGIARIQPLVIAMEDLHWADPSTLEAIQLLVEQGAGVPLYLICTARPEFHPPWPLRAHHAIIALNRMSVRDVREMAGSLTAHHALPAGTVEALIKRSGGVPLFVEELIRTAVESGAAQPALREIPPTLRDSLMARLDHLGESREIAQIASVIGREFSWQLLSALAAIDNEKLNAALKKLADAQLLLESGIPPEANYSFRHSLIEDAAYQSLLRSKRQRYHRRIAEVLERQFPEIVKAQPQLLAHHYTQAGLVELAIPHLQMAAHNAVQRSANPEAVSHLSQALELLNKLPETPERSRQELALQLALGTPLIAIKGFGSPEVARVYARARDLCRHAGQAPELFPVLWGLWVFYTARAEHMAARELAEQCLSLAESAQQPDLLIEAHHALGVTLTALPEIAPALEHLNHVITHHEPQPGGSMAFGQDPKVACLSQAAWTLWIHGYPHQALKKSDEAVTLAQRLSHPYTLVAALDFAAIVHQLRREAQAAQWLAETALRLSTEQTFGFWTPWALVMAGWAITQRGSIDEGIIQIRDAAAAFRATGAEVMVPYFLGLLAQACARAGRTAEGLAALAEAQRVADQARERWWESELCRLKGELTLNFASGRAPAPEQQRQAEECFNQALNIAARQSAKSLELRAVMSLSRLWHTQGKQLEARRILDDTYGWFNEGFDTADLQEAQTLLECMM